MNRMCNKSCFIRKVLPHLTAIAVFAAITILFFAPQFGGKDISTHDMVQASGMDRDIVEYIEEYGEHPQWAGRAFSGMPAYAVNMNYEGRIIKNLADQTYILGRPASWIFIAMAGFYLMLVLFGVNPWLGILGGVAYGLSSYFVIIIYAGHITKMMALAWIPPVIGSIRYAYRQRMWLGAALTGVFLAIDISTSHPQIPYYFMFVIVALGINELVRAYREKLLVRFAKTTGLLLLAVGLAFGANAIQLYYIADYTEDSTRGKSELTALADADNQTSGLDKDYITAWSYGKLETLNLLVPNLYGGGREFSTDGPVAKSLRPYQVPKDFVTNIPSYWGDQPQTDGAVYLGACVIFLAFLSLFWLRGREKWWIVAVSILAIFLAWGRHFMFFSDLFIDYFPLYNRFRTVSMILVIVQWSVPLLAVLALQKLWDGQLSREKFMRGMKWSLGIVGGLALFIGLFGPALSSFSSPVDSQIGLPDEVIYAMEQERASLMRLDAFRSLAFVLVSAALVWFFYNGKLKKGIFVAALLLFVTVDLFGIDKRYIAYDDFKPVRQALSIPMTEADRLILQDQSDYRVANFTVSPFMDATTSYYHRSIGGYSAAKLQRYQELIEHHLGQSNTAVYDMLNTKYFIVPGENNQPQVQVNPGAMGSAWYVPDIEWVPDADAELAALAAETGFDPAVTAVVDERFRNRVTLSLPAIDSTADVVLTEYEPNHVTYRTYSDKDGIVVFSEIFHPKGWTAYIDGQPAEYFRANYVLRAMQVPAGEHTVEFRFAAPHHALLAGITRASSLILLLGSLGLIIGGAVCRSRRNKCDRITDGEQK